MLHCEHTLQKPSSDLTGKMSTAKAKQEKSNQTSLSEYVREGTLTAMNLALFAINFSCGKKLCFSKPTRVAFT